MAHVVGVPKRDPCQKCKLPVFLAERLTVGKRVYHRTCLKCARCNSQLTPGSFYETEVDGEYCCETCPDEETSLEVETQAVLRNPSPESNDGDSVTRPKTTVRSSIADRLAFFEQSQDPTAASSSSSCSSKLLQKSLSDEEKTKSLKKMSGETSPPYKMNAALSSFMNSTLEDEIDGEKKEEEISLNSAQMESTSESLASSSESEDGDEEDYDEVVESEEKPPQLPTTLPPKPVESKSSTLEREKVPDSKEVEVKPEKEIEEKQLTTTAEITLRPIEKLQTDTNIKHDDESKNDDALQVEEEPISSTSITITTTTTDDLNLSKSKSNFVTKDNTEPDEQMRTTNATIVVDSTTLPPPEEPVAAAAAAGPAEKVEEHQEHQEEEEPMEEDEPKQQKEKPPLRQRPITLDIKTNCNSDMTAAHEDEETTNRLSVVRARLHQFEVIANNKNTNDNLMHRTPESSSNVNSSSIKSDSNSVKLTPAPVHQAEGEKAIETEIVSQSTLQTASSTATDVELKLKSDEEVPKNDETTEIEVDIEKENETETVSIEEINLKQLEDDDNGLTTPTTAITTSETNIESAQKSPRKVVAVEIEIDDDKVKQENKMKDEPQQTAMEVEEQQQEEEPAQVKKQEEPKPFTSPAKVNIELYPKELDPFKSDDEEDDIAPLPVVTPAKPVTPAPRRSLSATTPSPASSKKEDKDKSLNPFDSSDDEVEMEKKVKPPRPPPPKISKNPFGSESEEGGDENYNSMTNVAKKPPVPAPRNVSLSQNPTPEPTPRLSNKQANHHISPLNNSSDFYGSNSSLGSTPYSLQRNTEGRGSNNSLTSSTGTIRSRKSRKAPAPPPPVKELFPSTETLDSKKSSPSSSNSATPRQGRKKRPAPAPPKPARLLDPATVLAVKIDNNNDTGPKNSLSYPLQSDLDKLSDEEKALLEGNRLERTSDQNQPPPEEGNNSVRKLIPLDCSLVSDSEDLIKQKEEDNVVYRRTIVPTNIVTPTHDEPVAHDRQLEKMKDNKEAQNRNRQSQVSSGAEDSDPLYNKSSHGKWKRRKGPAPALPIPPRKVLQMLPLQEIRHELDIIEVQQQGLEKQGVILEKMIRDRCEGKNGELDAATVEGGNAGTAGHPQNSKEVEDLILQLFELVNEKNELFRRQAELMYLRRQHRLEQEQADLEYEIRVLMAQPERNKTDTDKAREEALIARMVEVVQLRNEVVECLEMDRLREAEEDLSIKQRLELHSAKREQEMNRHTLSKLSKKEKKKQKEAKKLGKSKKMDADKDADESELSAEKQKSKKKKKKFLF